MKLLAFLSALVVSISAWSAPVPAEDEYVAKPPNWQPIIGFTHPTQKAFIDKNNQMKNGSKVGAAILIFDTTPSIVVHRGNPIMYISVVKHVVIECNSGIVMPVYDLFYSVQMPGENDEPVQGIEYQTSSSNAIQLKKSSVMYQALCPIQV